MRPPRRLSSPLLAAVLAVGGVVSPLLAGVVPVGGDPAFLYRPLKAELARALAQGRLPEWSDRLGLGVPVVAESHAAAFYPPNIILYRLLNPSAAYRFSMWAHYVAAAAAMYAYARCVGISPWGSCLASVSLGLCGFQAIHTIHEPFYMALPYIPGCLALADRYAATGRAGWLAGLAAAWGASLTLGHFQLPMWAGGLSLLVGGWRVVADGRPRSRLLGLAVALGWGAAIAAAQLVPTWELTRVSGFEREFKFMWLYGFPIRHWPQLAAPALYLARMAEADPYWPGVWSSPGEACLYGGTAALVLACVGVAAGRDRRLAPWGLVGVAGFGLSTMPYWWLDGYWAVVQLPGLGWFRAPGRYSLIVNLAIALHAGRGLDRAIGGRRFGLGVAAAVALGAASVACGCWFWDRTPAFRASLGPSTLPIRLGATAAAWALSLGAIGLWRSRRAGAWAVVAVTAVELACLYAYASGRWHREVDFPGDSPTLRALRAEPRVELVCGRLNDMLTEAGFSVAYPYLGIIPPPPTYLLEPANQPGKSADPELARWMRRFGVSHGVWRGDEPTPGAVVVASGPDPTLDALIDGRDTGRGWKLVRYPGAFGPAKVGLRAESKPSWGQLYTGLSRDDAEATAWFLDAERPPDGPAPRASHGRILGQRGPGWAVDHDGTCDLVVRRAWYPGWEARVGGGPWTPVNKADGGLQSVRLAGRGPSDVEFRYRPTAARPARATSALAAVAALLTIGASAYRLKA